MLHMRLTRATAAGKVLGWSKKCRLAHTCLWEYSYKTLKLVQLLGHLGIFFTCATFGPNLGRGAARLLGLVEGLLLLELGAEVLEAVAQRLHDLRERAGP